MEQANFLNNMHSQTEFNNTSTNYPKDKTLIDLFDEIVKKSPKTVALEFEYQSLTYSQLNEKANQLANYLRKKGVKEEVLVGVCLERSLEMIIAVLAIIKAGAGYLPLETAYPEKRLEYLIKDANAEIILTQKKLKNKIESISKNAICLDEGWEEIEKESSKNFVVSVTPQNMAYVIYTSGSTGNPKGVIVSHQSIIRLVRDTNYIKIEPTDVFLQFTPISFDVSTFEIWASLLNQAKLVIFPAHKPTLNEIAERIKEYKITILWLISAIFHQMIEEQVDCFRGLKYLLSGGDVLGVKQVKKLLEEVPEITLINGYGPTENTTFTSCYVMTDTNQVGRTVSIGSPISNTQVYILDENFDILPVGVMGDLYTSGDGLARGYLSKPDLTAEKFLPNPFSNQPGARLYKTGDLASYLEDGNIEFFGRKDNQVKVRGFRIELGEIETVLDTHPIIKQNVVLVGETPLGDKQLIAYLRIKENSVFIINEIKEFLSKRLPEHMIPSRFIRLEEFPLTANEKVDRKMLLALSKQLDEAKDYQPPTTDEEKILADIWEKVLAIKNISILDNFFQLGGHSLLATRVVSRIRERFQIEISLSSFFSSENITELAKLIKKSKSLSSVVEVITPTPRNQVLPLSFSQKRVLFIHQLAPDNLAYSFHGKLEFKGKINLGILEKCFNKLVERHEIFRTTFNLLDGEGQQIIHAYKYISVPIVDLSEKPLEEKNHLIQEVIKNEVSKEFDISKLYLIRWLIIKLNSEEHILIHSEHHLVHDGWSFNVFLKELISLYQAYYFGEDIKLEELKIQFVDFAVWQNNWLESQSAKAQVAYWKENLAGCPNLLVLPYDRPRPNVQTFRGNSFRQYLSKELCDSLRDFSKQKNVTLFMTMAATFCLMLYRYSGQKDIALGSTVANRRLQEVENIIGMFVNNIVLRTILSEEKTFNELIEDLKQITLGAYENQDIPFDKVVEEINPERNLSYSPLCQVFFSFHDAQLPNLAFPEVEIKLTEGIGNGSAKFDISVIVIPHFEQSIGEKSSSNVKTISLVWEYNSDLFDDSTLLKMSNHYQALLERVQSQNKIPISKISFLSSQEYSHIIEGFNSWQKNYEIESFLPQLFQAQVLETPENIAVVFQEQTLTYQELNERANQLANYLYSKFGKQAVIGIYMQNSLDIVIAMMASLKASIAYVPLSFSYPIERLAFIIDDLKLELLITDSRLKTEIETLKVNKFYIDQEKLMLETLDKNDPNIKIDGQEIAYIIYTSGSTGVPKGVMITHQAMANHMVWMKNRFSITAKDNILQRTSISFDASIWEFYVPLISGAKLVLAESDFNADIRYLLEVIKAYEITTIQFVPSILNLMLQEENFADNKLKRVFSGGEILSQQLKELFLKKSKAELWNLYGPTEATIDTTYYQCTSEEKPSVLIGKAVDNLQIYILDKHLNPVPIGVIGEIYIGGVALARGYYNQVSLTAAKFIPNPFSQKKGERLYKTGDLARYLTDGNIEFFGRIDNQVKIRGFRIELGEIESALLKISFVKDAVVIAKELNKEDKVLVAYLVADQMESTVEEIQLILKAKLPNYMIPTGYVFLPAFPLMSNGKIDREALLKINPNTQVKKDFVAPRNTTEETIINTWSSALKQEKIGIYDNFFDLGGHSLIATKIISRLRKENNLEIKLRDIFENPTVASLAYLIEEKKLLTPMLLASEILPTNSNKQILDQVNQLPDEEVEKLLKKLSFSD